MVVVEAGLESAVKKAAGVFSDGGRLGPSSPNRGGVTEACYPIPAQICSKVLERQQLASGIRENRHGRDGETEPQAEDTSPPPLTLLPHSSTTSTAVRSVRWSC